MIAPACDDASHVTYPVATETTGRGHVAPPEEAALRRVATFVAEGVSPAELFAIVVEEVARVLGVPGVMLDRFESDRAMTVLASTIVPGFPTGGRWLLDGLSGAATVLETGPLGANDDYSRLEGAIGRFRSGGSGRRSGFRSWSTGGLGPAVHGASPPNRCARARRIGLRDFTELVAIAISAPSRAIACAGSPSSRTSLRRVATLVAKGA